MKSSLPVSGAQYALDLQIAAEHDLDGVGLGVLSDGTPFLTLRGLSRMVGVDIAAVVRITEQWQDNPLKPREKRIKELVRQQGGDDSRAFMAVPKNGVIYHAVPDAVCMAVLEYYAFDANSGATAREHAQNSYRVLARKGFRHFIYAQVGYNPTGSVDVEWQQFQDRASLAYDAVPPGYFSVFKEMASMFVTLIKAGAKVGAKFVPDISVGIHWSNYWKRENLYILHGERIRYDHNYPSYFPQAASNPQESYCYPDEALGDFRKWMREVYFKDKFPVYLSGKVKTGALTSRVATVAIEAMKPPKAIAKAKA